MEGLLHVEKRLAPPRSGSCMSTPPAGLHAGRTVHWSGVYPSSCIIEETGNGHRTGTAPASLPLLPTRPRECTAERRSRGAGPGDGHARPAASRAEVTPTSLLTSSAGGVAPTFHRARSGPFSLLLLLPTTTEECSWR
jgi:hypothetical protein